MSARARMKTCLPLIALLGTTLALSGCSGGDGGSSTEGGAATTSATSVDSTPEATDAASETVDNADWGISLSDTTLTDKYGTYTQVKVDEDSPLMQYDPALATEDTKAAFSADDITAALHTVSQFYVSEGIDSELVFDNSQEVKDAWLDRNTSKIDPSLQGDLYAVIENASLDMAYDVVEGNYGDWRHTDPYNIDPAPYGGTYDSRVYFREVEVTGISLNDQGDLTFDYSASYARPVVVDGTERFEMADATQQYSARQQADGSWALTYWKNDYTIDWQ